MEIQYFGANCVRINTKKANIVIDDNLAEIGLKSIIKTGDIVLQTFKAKLPNVESKIVIGIPGEYEVSNTSILGIAARSHMDEVKKNSATIFKIIADEVRIAIIGHVYPELNDEQLEALGTIDVLIIPVGGNGYTLDSIGALKIIKKIEPHIVIPTHYDDDSIKYEVPQQPLEEALKGLAMEPKETIAKFKIKPGEIAENTQLIVLERS